MHPPSLACVFLGPTLTHLTDGWQNYTSGTIRRDELYLSLLAKFQHFIKTSKRGMHNETQPLLPGIPAMCWIRLFRLAFSRRAVRWHSHSRRRFTSEASTWLTFPGIIQKTVLHGILKSSTRLIQCVVVDLSPQRTALWMLFLFKNS